MLKRKRNEEDFEDNTNSSCLHGNTDGIVCVDGNADVLCKPLQVGHCD